MIRTRDPLLRKQVLYPLSYEGMVVDNYSKAVTGGDQAGRAGFEPASEVSPANRLAGGPNQPLWHLPNCPADRTWPVETSWINC